MQKIAFTFEREHIILVFLSLNFLTPNVPPSSIHLPISQFHFNWQLWDTTFCKCATSHSSVDGHIGYVHFLWRQRNSVSVLRYRILWEILSRVVYLTFLHFIRILRSKPSSSCLEVGRVTAWIYALLSNKKNSLTRRTLCPVNREFFFLKRFKFMGNISFLLCFVASISLSLPRKDL